MDIGLHHRKICSASSLRSSASWQSLKTALSLDAVAIMFSDQYKGKHLFIDGEFKSIAVEKKGQKPVDGAEYVDAISGGTITSKGVQDMMKNSLEPYQNFFKSLK